MKRFLYSAIILSSLFAIACNEPPPGRGTGEIASAQGGSVQYRVETVVSDLEVPWSIAFAPDGRMFFTEREGRVRVFENGRLRAEPLAVIGDVQASGEGGLMGLTLHPEFAENHLLYL
ncbi:MAG TPA: PQQ-dependent sugar dehydrogenase, partial [Blastocatellia bacterium]|nr:PQQ-dependent sugar dehydrogenase [Blastocatellia bacterium]